MANIEMDFSGMTVDAQGDINILEGVTIGETSGDIVVAVPNAKFSGKEFNLLNNAKIGKIYSNLATEIQKMDKHSPEYAALQKLMSESTKDDTAAKKQKVRTHIASFAEGVLAGIVTNMLSK